MLIEKIVGKLEDYDIDIISTDQVVMTHEELSKSHQRVESQQGIGISISLPRGEKLFYGAVIHDEGNHIIYIEAAEEDILEILPKNDIERIRVAFNIGNMHHILFIKDECMLTSYDPAIERIIKSLNVKCRRKNGNLDGLNAGIDHIQVHDHGFRHE